MSLIVCLVAAIAPGFWPTAGGEGEPSVLRVHDIGALRPRVNSGAGGLAVLPSLDFVGLPDQPLGSTADLDEDTDFLVDLVLESFQAEFEYEGRELYTLENGGLVVRGPERLQRGVAALLGSLSEALWSETELVVDLVRGLELPEHLAGSSLVDADAIVPFLDQAAGKGALERFHLTAASGRETVLDVGRRSPLLVDYDVEVSEGAVISDPVVLDLQLGNRLGLRVAPGPGGLYLGLVLRRMLPLGPVREESFVSESHLNLGNPLFGATQEELSLQLQDVSHRSLALTSFLPDGRALVLASELDGDGGEVLVVRRSGPPLQSLLAAPSEHGAPGLRVIDLGSVHPPVCSSSLRSDFGNLPHRLPLGMDWDWRCDFFLQPAVLDHQGLLDLAQVDLESDPEAGMQLERWPWLVATGAAPLGAAEQRVEETLRALMPDARLVRVGLTLRHGGHSGPILARVAIPARVGAHSAVVLGHERQLMRDRDVEIAKYSATEDPVVLPSFEGLIVDLEPRLDARGGVVLDLLAFAARSAGGVSEIELVPGSRRTLQQEATDQLLLWQVLHFAAGGGPRQALLGDAAGALVLEVEVRTGE